MAKDIPQPTKIEHMLDESRQILAQLEAPYLRAKDYLKSQNFQDDKALTLDKIVKVAGEAAGRDWTGDRAMLAIGRIQEILAQYEDRTKVITEYESLKRTVAEQLVSMGR